jgi:hypothetical protein
MRQAQQRREEKEVNSAWRMGFLRKGSQFLYALSPSVVSFLAMKNPEVPLASGFAAKFIKNYMP